MSDRETGVEEARKVLGKLVDDAALDGDVTYLTRRGRRHAAIVPLDRIKETAVLNTEKLAAQIRTTLGDVPEDFHLDAIVEEIGDTYGRDLVDIDLIPSEEYWAIVRKHERSVVIYTRTTDEGTEATKVIRDGEEAREIYTVDGKVCDDSVVGNDNPDEYLRQRDTELRAEGYVPA